MTIGDRVYLRFAPAGEPGEVIAIERSRCRVRWADLGMETRHGGEDLLPVEAKSDD